MAAKTYTDVTQVRVMLVFAPDRGNTDRREAFLQAVDKRGGALYLEATDKSPYGYSSGIEALNALEKMVHQTSNGKEMAEKRLEAEYTWLEVVAEE
jgi:hypothetical protein